MSDEPYQPPLPKMTPGEFMEEMLTDAVDVEVESLALDYVEQVLGRKYFQEHWVRQPLPEHRRKVAEWLAYEGVNSSLTEPIIAELERLYRDGSKWIH